MKVHIIGIAVALVFSIIGAVLVIMSTAGEMVFLIILLWILIPVVAAKLYYRSRQ